MAGGSRVLIVEPRSSGHLLIFVRELVLEARRLGFEPIVALGAGVRRSDEFSLHLSDLVFQIAEFDRELSPRLLRALRSQLQIDSVIVPNGDELVSRALGFWRVGAPTTVLIMRDPQWELRSAGFLRRLKLLAKNALIAFAQRRSGVRVVWLRSFGYAGSKDHVIDPFISEHTPEQVMARGSLMRQSLGLDEDVFWFVITGAISMRKNVALVIESLRRVQELHPDRKIGLCIAGPVTEGREDVYEQIQRARDLGAIIKLHDRRLRNAEMNEAIVAADAVVMAYSSHSPNSTMLKARVLGVPIVVAGPPSVRSFAYAMQLELVGGLADLSFLMGRAVEDVVAPMYITDPPSGASFARRLLSQDDS